MKFSVNQSTYKGILISWNEKDGYFSATFNDLFYKKGVGFKKFKTPEDVKKKIDEMFEREVKHKVPAPEPEITKEKKKKK